MKAPRRISVAFKENQVRRCSAPRCAYLRWRVSQYCAKHCRSFYLFGSATRTNRVQPREYAKEREEVSSFIAHHAAHPGIVSATQWLAAWLEDVRAGRKEVTGYKWLSRLVVDGVSATEVLTELASVWLYASRNPHAYPEDSALTYGTGIAFLMLRPLPRHSVWSPKDMAMVEQSMRLPGMVRREVGERIRRTIGVLLARIADEINISSFESDHMRRSLHHPFTTSSTSTTTTHPLKGSN